MASYQIIVHAEDVTNALDNINNKLQQLDEFLLRVGELVSFSMGINFAYASALFSPLAASTIMDKEAMGYPLTPLLRTEAMRDAAVNGTWQSGGGSGSFYATLELPGYSGFHMTGTAFMPKRDFGFLQSGFSARLAEEFGAWLSV
jgi:hypothetical protein